MGDIELSPTSSIAASDADALEDVDTTSNVENDGNEAVRPNTEASTHVDPENEVPEMEEVLLPETDEQEEVALRQSEVGLSTTEAADQGEEEAQQEEEADEGGEEEEEEGDEDEEEEEDDEEEQEDEDDDEEEEEEDLEEYEKKRQALIERYINMKKDYKYMIKKNSYLQDKLYKISVRKGFIVESKGNDEEALEKPKKKRRKFSIKQTQDDNESGEEEDDDKDSAISTAGGIKNFLEQALESKYHRLIEKIWNLEESKATDNINHEQNLEKYRDKKEKWAKIHQEKFLDFMDRVRYSSDVAIDSNTGVHLQRWETEQFVEEISKIHTKLCKTMVKMYQNRHGLEFALKSLEETEVQGEGLQMLEYEQLQAENYSLKEKLEDRQRDVENIKGKIAHAVQILAHFRECMHRLQEKMEDGNLKLTLINKRVYQVREVTDVVTQRYEVFRDEETGLIAASGLLDNTKLLRNFEKTHLDCIALKEEKRKLIKLLHSKTREIDEIQVRIRDVQMNLPRLQKMAEQDSTKSHAVGSSAQLREERKKAEKQEEKLLNKKLRSDHLQWLLETRNLDPKENRLPSSGIVNFPAIAEKYKCHFHGMERWVGEGLSCAVVGTGIWSTAIFTVRNFLRFLFNYKGWMYEARGKGRKVSIWTKLWIAAVKLLSGWNKPMLYSFQGSLPSLPLPKVNETMSRYLRSVRPLMEDEQYARMERLAKEFESGIGKKLQRYLVLKSWWATNYVSDWWEEYVYLRGRSPIMVNSNFYGLDAILVHPTTIQAARAANITYGCLLFRRAIERQELEPIMIQGIVPLCSWQYERVFNTTRVPGEETDRIQHVNDSLHIAVYHRGRYFRMPIHHRGRLLKPAELQLQFQRILDNQSEPEIGEEKLAALTAWERNKWAQARQKYFSKGVNRASLDLIEKSAFVLVLDDEEYFYDPKDTSKLDHFARRMLHGQGYDRWFDKSFNIIVGTNGRVGFNSEHSWADAAILAHLWEFVIAEDVVVRGADAPVMGHMWEFCIGEEFNLGYDEHGNTRGGIEMEVPQPTRLKWEMPEECLETIELSSQSALGLLNDVDLKLYVHDHYGKGFMKTCRASPDAYIQMALQLAYYRDAGKFNLTYEASMTRLFREGRTETVRPCTIESCAWVKSMQNPSCTKEERIKLLQEACSRHQLGYQDAMCGKGIDRHLFCLYVVSKYLEVDSPFLKEVLSEPWRLSTSQTPHGQTTKLDLKVHPDCISAGGGFGPVADDGYGVSYIIAGEDVVFFHISSKKSSPETDSIKFAGHIEGALRDMKELFTKPSSINGVEKSKDRALGGGDS